MMTTRFTWLDWTALTLLVIGGLNWGLIGLFEFDLVAAIFGPATILSRIVYTLVGIAALYTIYMMSMFMERPASERGTHLRRAA